MGTLDGRVAIVTGASRGLGKDIAISLGKQGATVVATARTENEGDSRIPGSLSRTVELVGAAGGKGIAMRCDVTRDEEIEDTVAKVVAQFGKLDILVNNAGILVPGSLMEMQSRHFDLQYRVNVRAPFMFCRTAIPHMTQNGWGHIVNISSGGSVGPGQGPYKQAGTGGSSYGATKAALERMTQGLAAEVFDRNIAANSLSPEIGEWSEGGHYFRSMGDGEPVYAGWRMSGEIIGDAAALICSKDPQTFTGRILYDERLFRSEGMTFDEVRSRYPVEPGDRRRS
ncbi:MAG: SDR family NAD(P)-dependent oxidoreductase [Candidatus Brocadiia bacterium]|jgi:NAD(P)-dependent dehydrogenase (short-subunit alcohol dehydrogenase family)|nr:SDR family NAD(P)-dependent oxidoreductase [Candidatus Brocadiia bacterium]